MNHLGIDIAKRKFDVALIRDGKYRTHVFENTAAGHRQLLAWLKKHDGLPVPACMEAAGEYGTVLATFLYDVGVMVSMIC